jgi:hypothetical protein
MNFSINLMGIGLSSGKLSELFAERYGSICFWNASFPAGTGYIPNDLRFLRWGGDGEVVQPEKD